MKKLFLLTALATAAFFTSCSNDDNSGIAGGGEGSTNYKIEVTSAKLTPQLSITSTANTVDTVKVHFEGAENGMRRLYITKNDGSGRAIYNINARVVPPVELNEDDKSIDLSKNFKREFTFDIPFETPKQTNGVVVYKLWATKSPFLNSKGDIQNEDFRNAYKNIGVATIIIKAGTAVSNSPVKEFSVKLKNSIKLGAPTANGKSESFVSILNGKTSKIVQQKDKNVTDGTVFTAEEKAENAEFVSYWDFGYFYQSSKGASLSSANDYMNAFQVNKKTVIDITNMSGLSKESLNKFYFKKDSTVSFDSVNTSGDLDAISTTTASPQTINNLAKGDIIQFLSGNGVKGLIRVDEINPGFEEVKYIKFSVKVQNVDYVKL